jgi:hypothetical protein
VSHGCVEEVYFALNGHLRGALRQLHVTAKTSWLWLWFYGAGVGVGLQALTPQMTENKKRVEELLREALILQAALSNETEPGLLERLLPKRYKQYQKGISSRA